MNFLLKIHRIERKLYKIPRRYDFRNENMYLKNILNFNFIDFLGINE